MSFDSPSLELLDCANAFLPPGPGFHDSFSPMNVCAVSASGDGPAGPTSSPGSEQIISLEKMLSPSSILGTVSYLLRRKNPEICSLFHGNLITKPDANPSDNIAVYCRDEHSEVCGIYPSVKDFILAVRSSSHPMNQLFEGDGNTQDDDDAPHPTIGERPGFACPASLLSDPELPSREADGATSAPLHHIQPPAPQSAPLLPSRSTLPPRPAAPSLLLIDESDPAPPARSRSPDRESRTRARPTFDGPNPAAGPTPGSPMRGVSPRRAALLEE
jgi:hypothetical protein